MPLFNLKQYTSTPYLNSACLLVISAGSYLLAHKVLKKAQVPNLLK